MAKHRGKSFGETLREKRVEKGFTLRKFAQAIGVSPTYLSQVEQEKMSPPSPGRIKQMAELLGANSDEWIALAGRMPGDLKAIIQEEPTEFPELLREASGLTAEQIRKLRETAKRLKRDGG
jgi:transcriptional regulator with XRE-family HTH domain